MRNGLVGPGRGVVGPRLSGLVQLPNQTSRDYSGQSGLLVCAPTTRTARHKNSLTQAIFSLNNCKTFITIQCPS